MNPLSSRRGIRGIALAGVAALIAVTIPLAAASAQAADPVPDPGLPGSQLFVNPYSTTLEAAQSLSGDARSDAQLLGSIASAQWFTKGTPAEVQASAAEYVDAAASAGAMPVLVAYNLPFRDCAQYSSGGAADTAAYKAWIDGLVAGIGARPATVILEPDGLGIIPHYVANDGAAGWCNPTELNPATAASDRFAQLNYAVDALKALPATSVYLDGVHSGWLNVGDITDRLIKGGVERADGFFLNASNYQFTTNLTAYGTWISSCIAAVTLKGAVAKDCPNQYWNGGPSNGWTGVALSGAGEWSTDAADPTLNIAGINERYVSLLGATVPTTSFVIDTSRNGQGPWAAPAGKYTDAEDWCNPPGRGLGAQPTTNTGNPLVDAHLWIKVPGESDGQCYRGTGGPLDPERGIEDPAAGQWFPAQVQELIALAAPPIAPLTCKVAVVGKKTGFGFVAALTVENRGTTTLSPWQLSWTFSGDQKISKVVGGTYTQSGNQVTVTAPKNHPKLAPGKKTAVVVTGKGAASAPWQFQLNGKACLTR